MSLPHETAKTKHIRTHKIKSDFFNIVIPPTQKPEDYSRFFDAAKIFFVTSFRCNDDKGGESIITIKRKKELKLENESELEVVFHFIGEVETLVSPEIIDFFEFVADEKAGVDNTVLLHFFG